MKKEKRWIKYGGVGALIIVLTLSIIWMLEGGSTSKAAEGVININTSQDNTTYSMRSKIATAYIEGVQAGTSVKWSTSDDGIIKIGDNSGTGPFPISGSNVTLTAAGLGSATITAVYTDTEGIEKTLIRVVDVPSAIVQDTNFFRPIHSSDEKFSMVLSLTDINIQGGILEMLYPVSNSQSITWSSSNPYVVSMNKVGDTSYSDQNSTGEFRATGTGKATIRVSYTDISTGNPVTDEVEVYVGPNVSVGSNPTSNGSGGYVAHKDDVIYTGAETKDNNATINDKISWILTDSTGSKILQKSADGSTEYLSSEIYSSVLTITAPAGTYNLYTFTAGTYKSGDSLTSNDIPIALKDVTVIQVLPTVDKVARKITLQTGDSYDFAKAMNLTTEDFNRYFTLALKESPELGTVVSGVFTAGDVEGEMVYEVKFTDAGLSARDTFFGGKATTLVPFDVSITIYKGYTLDRSQAFLYVGGSLQLSTLYGGNKGIETWKSSDPNKVTVDKNSGLITAKASTGDNFVTITVSMLMPDGKTLTATCKVKVDVTATKINLSETYINMKVGETTTIKATFQPNSVTTANLQWLVNDESVVSVAVNSETSVEITAKKAGTAILTAVNKDNYITAYCYISVISPIKTITLNQTAVTVTLSQEVVKLTANYQPIDATANELKWTTSDSSIATVDQYGLVTLKKAGSCLITVMPVWNESNVMAQCYLTVIASPTSFALDKTSITLEVGEKSTITPVLTAAGSTTTITWRTMDSRIASVSNGVVTAVSPGQTFIIASTKEGFVANCLVTVTQKASGVALDVYTIKIAVGETYTVKATANPASSTEKTFTWNSQDAKIASVKDGTVTGVSAGSTTIFVKTKSGEVVYLYVTVYDKAKGMTLNYANKELAKGSTFKLTPIFTPTNVTNRKVTFTSLNTKVATINANGTVKGNTGGVAIITAVAEDGNYMATCLVTVVEAVSNIKLNHKSYTLGLGKSLNLKATVTSNAASNPKIKWTSSNSSVATVNSSGKVSGKKAGSTTITATVTDGSKKKATCRITVVRQVTSISMNKPILTIMVGKTQKLKATIKPSNATYKTAKWSSSDPSVAMVDSVGNVTGLSVGTTTIKAEAKDNSKKAVTCHVNVIDPIPASAIVLASNDIILINGQSEMISYTVTPSNSTDKVTFSSNNKAIATVSATGRVTARRTGNATITLTSTSGKQAVVNVRVIGLNKTRLILEQYDTETLVVEGVTSAITWYSGNPSIATVSGGKVVARKKGTTTIYAKVNGITLSCQVTVKSIK